MSIHETKVVFRCYCAVVMSPSICVIIFICVNLMTSSYAEKSSMMFDALRSPSNKNLSHEVNQTSVKIRESYNMNNIEQAYNFSKETDIHQSFSESKASLSLSFELIKQLQYNMRRNFITSNNISNVTMSRIPFHYNYEDYSLGLNDSMLDDYGFWDELNSSNGENMFDSLHVSILNLTEKISSLHPFLTTFILNNITGTKNAFKSLSDIVMRHQLSLIINQQNYSSYTEKDKMSDDSISLPPWENLTIAQKNYILKQGIGEPQKYSNATVLALTAFYGALLSVGIPGNGLTILIILTNSYMRSAPNIFLFNIALADLLTLTLGMNTYLNGTLHLIIIRIHLMFFLSAFC